MPARSNTLTILVVMTVLAGAPVAPAAASPQISFCIDAGSPSVTHDRKVAKAAAEAVGATARIVTFDSRTAGDEGFTLRDFRALARKRCNLIMGFPLESGSQAGPKGLLHTSRYLDTGFVLVTTQGMTLDQLPASSRIAVTYNTPANLFFVKHKDLQPIVYDSEDQGLAALAAGRVQAAAVWQLGVANYERHHRAIRGWKERAIDLPHARWQLTALYLPRSKEAARRFEKGLKRIRANGTTSPAARAGKKATDPYPHLYTAAQADRGAKVFSQHCMVCHGAKLQGDVGPALKGSAFASPEDHFTVGGIFTFLSQQMPGGQPGSLTQAEYANVMAFLLRENGYQPGQAPLTYNEALASKAPLVAHSPAPREGGTVEAGAEDTYPHLYTAAQADRGAKVFSQHCVTCHGAKLQGDVGPALKGSAFASPEDHFTVGGIFTFLSQQMPGGQPGSLKKAEYANVMAFLLRENGYQPGKATLTYSQALGSKVPLVAHGRGLEEGSPKLAGHQGN